MEALRDGYSMASAESRAKADTAYQAMLRYASNPDEAPDHQPDICFAAHMQHLAHAKTAHLCFVQVDGITLPEAQLVQELALIADLQSRADDLRQQSEESRAAAVATAKAAGLSEVTIDFSEHESQRLKDRAMSLESRIITVKGSAATPGQPASGLIKLRQDVRAARVAAERELYSND